MKFRFLKNTRPRYKYSFYFALIPFVINLIAFLFDLIKFDPFLNPITTIMIIPLFILSFVPQIFLLEPLLILLLGDKSYLLFNLDPMDAKIDGFYTDLGTTVIFWGTVLFYILLGMIVGLLIEKFRNRKKSS